MKIHPIARCTLCAFLAVFMLPAAHAQEEIAGAEKEASSAPEVKVTLLDAGQEPRIALRFRPEKGFASEMEMVMRMQAKQTMNGVEMPSQKIPPMRMVVAMSVDDIADNGDAIVTGRFTKADVLDEPGVMPMVREQMSMSMRAMEGLAFRQVVSDRGVTRNATFDKPEGVNPMVAQQLEEIGGSIRQFGNPVPEEPVGVGARWKIETVVTQNGIAMRQMVTSTVTSIDGETVKLDLQTELEADPQDIDNPMMPPGATMRLTAMKGEGTGNSTLRLSGLFSNHTEVNSSMTFGLVLNMGGKSQDIGQQMEMSVTSRPREMSRESGDEG